jgi:hypothetical protein
MSWSERRSAGRIDGPVSRAAPVAASLAEDVPDILDGLVSSGSVSAATAATARRLAADGDHQGALTMALEEAFWRVPTGASVSR